MSEGNYENILLSNREQWKELMLYNLITSKKELISRTSDNIRIQGHYVRKDGDFVMFYKKSNKLHFQVEGKEYYLESDDCKVTFERMGRLNRFCIEISNNTVFSHTYRSWRYDPLNMVDIDFNEDMEENQDFYLFVYNVMQDKDWRKRIYSKLD